MWGLLANSPYGGMTWQVLHYLAGLRDLGFDVWYVEDNDEPLRDSLGARRSGGYTVNLDYLAGQLSSIGLADRWIFRPPGEARAFGARDIHGLERLYAEADAVLNLCGSHRLRPEHLVAKRLTYVETDPVVNQVRVAQGRRAYLDELDRYDFLFTYGENLGRPDCLVPIERYEWIATRPPVVLEWWGAHDRAAPPERLTTVTSWQHAMKDVQWNGHSWRWSKHHEFLRFRSVASRSPLPLELAVADARESDTQPLADLGWHISDAARIADPDRYADYIVNSMGEFTVAKEQYVLPRTGWFSDRSVCYLAAGRPVVTQETGFSRFVPTGTGLLAFESSDDAVAALDSIADTYDKHCSAARDIARSHFATDVVLAEMLARIGLL